MIPLTLLVSYVGEPLNQQVFEHQPSTVRPICSCFLLPRNCTSMVKGFKTVSSTNLPETEMSAPFCN